MPPLGFFNVPAGVLLLHLLKFKASGSKLNSRPPKSPPVEIQASDSQTLITAAKDRWAWSCWSSKRRAANSKRRPPKSPPVEIQSVGQQTQSVGRQRSLGLELLGLELLESRSSPKQRSQSSSRWSFSRSVIGPKPCALCFAADSGAKPVAAAPRVGTQSMTYPRIVL